MLSADDQGVVDLGVVVLSADDDEDVLSADDDEDVLRDPLLRGPCPFPPALRLAMAREPGVCTPVEAGAQRLPPNCLLSHTHAPC